MKIYIGPYRDWIGPYQIADKLFFWLSKDKRFEIGGWMAGPDGKDTWLQKVCAWVESHKKRKVKIRIDKYDTWSMDHTLALIILPMLKQLHETKHGAPCVDDEDVPEGLGLRSTEAPPKENDYDIDDNHFKRWDWVLEEMIQAFECKNNEDWSEKYWTGTSKIEWQDSDTEYDGKKCKRMVELGDRKCDWDAYRAHEERNKNGFRLFGKYYQALWD
jgi:hypothetical protein